MRLHGAIREIGMVAVSDDSDGRGRRPASEIGRGSRVVLRPARGRRHLRRRYGGDGRRPSRRSRRTSTARCTLAVTLEDDPGRELGEDRRPGHRFFFAPDEVEPMAGAPPPTKRVLVAGIGNIFFGDDGFGVAVAAELKRAQLPPGVDVVDFGIRGMDLVFALGEGYDLALFVDAVPRGEAPGTVFLIEPELEDRRAVMLDAHGMDPVKVLALAGQLARCRSGSSWSAASRSGVTGEDEEMVGRTERSGASGGRRGGGACRADARRARSTQGEGRRRP